MDDGATRSSSATGRARSSSSTSVQLAFDEKVVLTDVSFTLIKGHTKIILGASGVGEVDDPEDHHWACCAPTRASSG